MYNFKIYICESVQKLLYFTVSQSFVMHLPEDGHVSGWNV